jgi:glycosyltransferase involved in cell wall biosynthesis
MRPGTPILFLPIIDWAFRRQRPQQLARCFARAGSRVYYPCLRLRSSPPPPCLVGSGIWQIALKGNEGLDPYRDRLSADDVDEAVASLLSLAADHPLDGCWIVVQLPFWRPLAEALREIFGGHLLFDCMDDFSSFGDHADVRGDEAALAATADLVVVTAQTLFDKLAPHNPRCRIVRNGCDPEHFGPAVARRSIGAPPIIGFFGGIHDWFDVSLVESLASLRPHWEIWLVGDTYRADVEPLRRLANVTLFGEVPYGDLPRLVSFFDTGIIPFRVTPLTEATNPVKVYEMLAAGLPVVAVDLPELRPLRPWVSFASTAGEFAVRIEEALDEPPEARAQRHQYALRHSWVERFLELRSAMSEAARAEVTRQVRDPGLGAVTLTSLGIVNLGDQPRELLPRIAHLQRELEKSRNECDRLVNAVAGLDSERTSLIEQRDRVQGEAERLRRELERVEAERLRLETAPQQRFSSRKGRLRARLNFLRFRRQA